MSTIQSSGNPIVASQYQAIVSSNPNIQTQQEPVDNAEDSIEFSVEGLQLAASTQTEDPISDDPFPTQTPDPPD